MIITFLQFLLCSIAYFLIVVAVYWLTEVRGVPKWMDFKPLNCRTCNTFWTLLTQSIIIGISFNWWYYMGMGIALAILTAIAMKVDQKNKTVSINDDNFFNK